MASNSAGIGLAAGVASDGLADADLFPGIIGADFAVVLTGGRGRPPDSRPEAGATQKPAVLSLSLSSQFKRTANRINDSIADAHTGIRRT